jgi:hypothetical protein
MERTSDFSDIVACLGFDPWQQEDRAEVNMSAHMLQTILGMAYMVGRNDGLLQLMDDGCRRVHDCWLLQKQIGLRKDLN